MAQPGGRQLRQLRPVLGRRRLLGHHHLPGRAQVQPRPESLRLVAERRLQRRATRLPPTRHHGTPAAPRAPARHQAPATRPGQGAAAPSIDQATAAAAGQAASARQAAARPAAAQLSLHHRRLLLHGEGRRALRQPI